MRPDRPLSSDPSVLERRVTSLGMRPALRSGSLQVFTFIGKEMTDDAAPSGKWPFRRLEPLGVSTAALEPASS